MIKHNNAIEYYNILTLGITMISEQLSATYWVRCIELYRIYSYRGAAASNIHVFLPKLITSIWEKHMFSTNYVVYNKETFQLGEIPNMHASMHNEHVLCLGRARHRRSWCWNLNIRNGQWIVMRALKQFANSCLSSHNRRTDHKACQRDVRPTKMLNSGRNKHAHTDSIGEYSRAVREFGKNAFVSLMPDCLLNTGLFRI